MSRVVTVLCFSCWLGTDDGVAYGICKYEHRYPNATRNSLKSCFLRPLDSPSLLSSSACGTPAYDTVGQSWVVPSVFAGHGQEDLITVLQLQPLNSTDQLSLTRLDGELELRRIALEAWSPLHCHWR